MTPVDESIDQNYIEHGGPVGQPPGIDGFEQFIAMVATAFQDLQVSIEDLIAEEDKVVAHVTVRGTHKGTLMGNIPQPASMQLGRALPFSRSLLARLSDAGIKETF